jgi:curved DNA-binding protein CbpA
MPKFVDYYAILGVSMDAPWTELKVAYLREALVLHPDKNFDPNATLMFQMVSNLSPNPIFPNHFLS